MMLRMVCLAVLALGLAVSASAQNDIYDNGPTNGNVDAWTINFGFLVSDAFTLNSSGTVNGLQFSVWLTPGDVLQSVEVIISEYEAGGFPYFDQVVSLTQSGCTLNSFNYDVCLETGSFAGVNLSAGEYWLTLENAQLSSGNPVYWDENDGPSRASETSTGSIPSESFTMLGSMSSTTATTSTSPEPASVVLLGSGILAPAGFFRRRLL